MDDRELLRQYAERHAEDAFRKLVDRHLPMVYSAAMRILRDQQLSEEIAQNAFRKLAEAALQLRPAQVVVGWLYNTTRNLALNALRSERRRRERETIACSMQTLDSQDPLIQEDLELVMAELDPEDRDLLVLRFLESRSLCEVGEELGITEEAARKRVTRALDRLREQFEPRGTTISATVLGGALSAATLAVPSDLTAAIVTSVCGEASTTTTGIAVLSTVQKVLLASALVAALTFAVYETRQSSRLRRNIAIVGEKRSELAFKLEESMRQLDQATQRLAALSDQNDLLRQNPSELLRLRNELATLRRERLAASSIYGGKSVIEWLREYDPKASDLTDEAKNALRKIGTNAVPDLLSALLSSEVGYTRQASAAGKITPWQVTCAFRALGPFGKPAVASLIEFLQRSDSEWLQIQAAACLGFIGPEANAAVPRLLECIRNQESDPLRVNSIGALVRIGGDRSLLLPVFSSSLADSSSTVRDWAATGMGNYGAEAATVIPQLVTGLNRRDEEPRVLCQELKAIEAIGPTTNDIAPNIQKFLTHPHPGVRMGATNALSRIAPQLFPQSALN